MSENLDFECTLCGAVVNEPHSLCLYCNGQIQRGLVTESRYLYAGPRDNFIIHTSPRDYLSDYIDGSCKLTESMGDCIRRVALVEVTQYKRKEFDKTHLVVALEAMVDRVADEFGPTDGYFLSDLCTDELLQINASYIKMHGRFWQCDIVNHRTWTAEQIIAELNLDERDLGVVR